MRAAFLFIVLVIAPTHDFHLSLTEIEHDPKTKSLQVSIKLFTDDLMLGLEMAGAPKMELGTKAEPPVANELIQNYLRRHFRVSVNGVERPLTYLGKEAELDATWCYLEAHDIQKVDKLVVTNTLLLDAFDDQTNMIHVNVAGRKKSGMGRRQTTSLTFEY